jgi:hypothetical protein
MESNPVATVYLDRWTPMILIYSARGKNIFSDPLVSCSPASHHGNPLDPWLQAPPPSSRSWSGSSAAPTTRPLSSQSYRSSLPCFLAIERCRSMRRACSPRIEQQDTGGLARKASGHSKRGSRSRRESGDGGLLRTVARERHLQQACEAARAAGTHSKRGGARALIGRSSPGELCSRPSLLQH